MDQPHTLEAPEVGHKPGCRCPICSPRPPSAYLTSRLQPELLEWLRARPEGVRAWLEARIQEAMEAEGQAD